MLDFATVRKAKIIIEAPDGLIYSGIVEGFEVSIEQRRIPVSHMVTFDGPLPSFSAGPFEWTIRARGMGDLTCAPSAEEYTEAKRQAPEHECLWCGATNLKEQRQCPQCGGWRPVL